MSSGRIHACIATATFVALLAIARAVSAQLPNLTPAQWRADLDELATRLPAAHGDLFHLLAQAEFERMIDSLASTVDAAAPETILTGIARIVAAVGEGHTSARILMPAMHAYPMLVHVQDDGVRIRRVPIEHHNLLGARVLRVEGIAIDSARTRLATVISADNAMGVRAWLPYYLVTREVLSGLRLDDGNAGLSLDVERADGVAQNVVLHAAPLPDVEQLLFGDTVAMISAGGDAPLVRDTQAGAYWFRWLPAERAMFVRIDRLMSQPDVSFGAFVDSLFDAVDRLQAGRIVLDVRSLSGGNHISLPLIHALVRRPQLAAHGRVLVLIGRNTFSAGQNLVTLLEQHVAPVFIGEPTGGRPNAYGVLGRFVLPNSGLEIRHARYYIQDSDPADYRHWQAPHIMAPPDVLAEMRGSDPALEAALAFDGALPWSQALHALDHAAADDDVRDLLAAIDVHRDVLRSGGWAVEQRINALGYARLRARRSDDARAIFRANVELFPNAWNAWDSLAEALVATGEPLDARAAYERSLSLNGYNDNARRGLALLRLLSRSPPP